MPLINIVIALIVVGVALWLINNFIPMAGSNQIHPEHRGGNCRGYLGLEGRRDVEPCYQLSLVNGMRISSVVLLCAFPMAAVSQDAEPLGREGQIRFPYPKRRQSLIAGGVRGIRGILQGLNSPREWGQVAAPMANGLPPR